jgi:hypothetical protein
VFAPNPYQNGSSVSHFHTLVTPNQLMEPSYTGPNHNISLTLQLFSDEGWTLAPPTTVSDTDTLTVTQTSTSWDLKVKIANTGSGVANNVVASMSGGPAWLSIPDPNGGYPNLAAGASSFNTDAYTLDLTNWPGGPFQVNLQVSWVDPCGSHSQTVVLDLKPFSPLTGVGNHPAFVNRLDANVPNPFNPSTTIHYEIGKSGRAMLRVYDVSGALVRTLWTARTVPATTTHWDGATRQGMPVSSGVYSIVSKRMDSATPVAWCC